MNQGSESASFYSPWSFGSSGNKTQAPDGQNIFGTSTSNYGSDIHGFDPKSQAVGPTSAGGFGFLNTDAYSLASPAANTCSTPRQSTADTSNSGQFPSQLGDVFCNNGSMKSPREQFYYNQTTAQISPMSFSGFNDLDKSALTPMDKFSISHSSERFALDDLVSKILDDEHMSPFGLTSQSDSGQESRSRSSSDVFSYDGYVQVMKVLTVTFKTENVGMNVNQMYMQFYMVSKKCSQGRQTSLHDHCIQLSLCEKQCY